MIGIGVAIMTRGLRWLVAAHALMAVPYVFAAGVDSNLSQIVTGYWYNDSVRLGALVPVTALPLAAVGLTWLVDRSVRLAARAADRVPWLRDPRRLGVVAVAGTTVALVALTSDASTTEMYTNLASRYTMTATAQDRTLLSADELRLLERLPHLVPAGSRVAANPWDGAGLAYAVSGVQVLVPQLGARPAGEAKVVAEGLADANNSPSVCRALNDLNIHYALDFGLPLGSTHGLRPIRACRTCSGPRRCTWSPTTVAPASTRSPHAAPRREHSRRPSPTFPPAGAFRTPHPEDLPMSQLSVVAALVGVLIAAWAPGGAVLAAVGVRGWRSARSHPP